MISACQTVSPSGSETLRTPLLADTDDETAKPLTVDQILDVYVGGFGKAQLIHVVVVTFAWTVDAMHTLIAVFSDSRPGWRCLPGAEHVAESDASAPFTSQCAMDRRQWEWIHTPHASIVSEWRLVCRDAFKAGIPASLFFIGCILGAGVLGRLADTRLGRKRTLILSCAIVSVAGFLTSASPNVWVYSLTRLISGFGRAGIGTSSLVLSTEAVGSRLGGQVGIAGFLFFTAGFMLLPGIAYMTRRSWRLTYVVISAISATYTCLFLPFVWESPRWLAVRQKQTELLAVLQSMAICNHRSLPENLCVSVSGDRNQSRDGGLWRCNWARKRITVVMAASAGSGLVYYGMPLNIGNLGFNIYVSTILNALMELPAVVLGTFLLPRVGRKPLIMFSSVACAALCAISAICAAFSEGKELAVMVAEVAAFLAVCVAFDVWYIFCVELFSTDVRNAAVAAMRQAIMAGAALAPIVLSVMGGARRWAAFVLFGVFSVWTAALVVLFPETVKDRRCEPLQERRADDVEPNATP